VTRRLAVAVVAGVIVGVVVTGRYADPLGLWPWQRRSTYDMSPEEYLTRMAAG
jgi:hypothetical protein